MKCPTFLNYCTECSVKMLDISKRFNIWDFKYISNVDLWLHSCTVSNPPNLLWELQQYRALCGSVHMLQQIMQNIQIMQNMQIAKCWSFLHSAFRMEISQCTNFSVFRVEVFPLSKRIFRGFELVSPPQTMLKEVIIRSSSIYFWKRTIAFTILVTHWQPAIIWFD